MTETNETIWTEFAAMLRSDADTDREFAAGLGDPIEAAEFDARRNRKSRRQRIDAVNAREKILQAIEDRIFVEGESVDDAKFLRKISRYQTMKSLVYPKAAEFRHQLIAHADRIDALLEKIEAGLKDD